MHANTPVRPLRAKDEQSHVETEKSDYSANFITQASHGVKQEQQAMPAIDHHADRYEARPGDLFQIAQYDCANRCGDKNHHSTQ